MTALELQPAKEEQKVGKYQTFIDAIAHLERLTTPPNPTTGVRAGGQHVESQYMTVSKTGEDTRISFKLRNEFYTKILAILTGFLEEKKANDSFLKFATTPPRTFSESILLDLETQGFSIEVAKAKLDGWEIRSAIGVIEIKFKTNSSDDLDHRLNTIETVFDKLLGIPDILQPPSQEDLEAYKRARYAWSHKLDLSEIPEVVELEEATVIPGYTTYIEIGRMERLRAGSFAVFHSIKNIGHLVDIIKNGGLLSHVERLKRGLDIKGVSSTDELQQGGGDSVFTRIIPETKIGDYKSEWKGGAWGIVITPSVLNRTDYWCQGSDTAGSTKNDTFSSRLSPEEYFDRISEGKFAGNNEQMFRNGIPTSDFLGIVCAQSSKKEEILQTLRDAGITTINNIPIEEFVVVTPGVIGLITLSH